MASSTRMSNRARAVELQTRPVLAPGPCLALASLPLVVWPDTCRVCHVPLAQGQPRPNGAKHWAKAWAKGHIGQHWAKAALGPMSHGISHLLSQTAPSARVRNQNKPHAPRRVRGCSWGCCLLVAPCCADSSRHVCWLRRAPWVARGGGAAQHLAAASRASETRLAAFLVSPPPSLSLRSSAAWSRRHGLGKSSGKRSFIWALQPTVEESSGKSRHADCAHSESPRPRKEGWRAGNEPSLPGNETRKEGW